MVYFARIELGTIDIDKMAPHRYSVIKIGQSENVRLRIANLRASLKVPVYLMGVLPGGVEKERALHRRFRKLRFVGEYSGSLLEWFYPSADLQKFILEKSRSIS